jgi:hypothetical protein
MIINKSFDLPAVKWISATNEVVAFLVDLLHFKTPTPHKDEVQKDRVVAFQSTYESMEELKLFVADKCPGELCHPRHHDILYRTRYDSHFETFTNHLRDITANAFDPIWMFESSEQYEKFVTGNETPTMGPRSRLPLLLFLSS